MNDSNHPEPPPDRATLVQAAFEAMHALSGPERVQVIKHFMGSARKALVVVRHEAQAASAEISRLRAVRP